MGFGTPHPSPSHLFPSLTTFSSCFQPLCGGFVSPCCQMTSRSFPSTYWLLPLVVFPFKFPAPLKSFHVFISELYKSFGVFQMTGVCVSISLACLGLSAHISVETCAGTRPPEQQPSTPPQHSQGPGPRILPCEGGTKSCKNPLDGVKSKDAN